MSGGATQIAEAALGEDDDVTTRLEEVSVNLGEC